MGEDSGDVEAARAFHIHEVAVGALDQAFQLVLPGLGIRAGVKEIFALKHESKHYYFRLIDIIKNHTGKREERRQQQNRDNII